jgi:hypothetical protein
MSCALTAGYTLGCRDSVGGIKEVRFIEFANVTGIAITSGFVVSGITTSGSTKFWKYDLTKQTSQFTETITPSMENGTIFYQQDLQIVLNKMTAALRNELRLLGRNRLIAIVTDRNGNNWLLGSGNGLDLSAGTGQSGTAFGDRNGFDVTFTGMEEQPMYTVQANIIAALTNA